MGAGAIGSSLVLVTFPCPSAPFPIGGVIALYEFANGMARRGHDVQVAHGPFMGNEIDGLEDLSWFTFDDRIDHRFVRRDDVVKDVSPADVIFGTGTEARLGLPVQLVQGFDMLNPGLERDAMRTPSLKVCVASWLLGLAEPLGMSSEQFRFVPMGYDHDHFRIRTPLDDRPPQVSILYSTHPAKGWTTGFKAIEAVRRRRPDIEVVAFGIVDEVPDLPSWVTFVAQPSRDELVEKIYDRSRVFVQPSLWEGFGFTAVEAMACGASLVTTDNGGSWDYAEHDRTALVSAPGDPVALAAHLEALMEDDDRRVRIGTAGSELVKRFDWDLGAERLESVLEEYLADPDTFLQPPVGEPAAVDTAKLAARLLSSRVS